jgi:serine/threonine protein kinase
LDGGVYAIKRIELNPKNKQLNRKITREVKLLSRLNHENVVRYYNSWIESATIEPASTLSSVAPSSAPIHTTKQNSNQVSMPHKCVYPFSVCRKLSIAGNTTPSLLGYETSLSIQNMICNIYSFDMIVHQKIVVPTIYN